MEIASDPFNCFSKSLLVFYCKLYKRFFLVIFRKHFLAECPDFLVTFYEPIDTVKPVLSGPLIKRTPASIKTNFSSLIFCKMNLH